MSNRLNLPLLGDKALEMAFHRKKKKEAAAGSSCERAKEATDTSSPPPPKFPKRKKRDATVDLTDVSDKVILEIPSSGCTCSDFGPIAEETKKLLLEGDHLVLGQIGAEAVATSHYKTSFTNLQEAAFLQSQITESAKKERAHMAERKNWSAEKSDFISRAQEFSRDKASLEATILAKDQATERIAREHENAIKDLQEQIMDVRIDTEIKTMAYTAEEYEKCLPGRWDVSQYKARLAKLERLNAGLDSPTNDGDNADEGGLNPPVVGFVL